jgi:hypothetical protein
MEAGLGNHALSIIEELVGLLDVKATEAVA